MRRGEAEGERRMERLDTSNMTDLVREAFENEYGPAPNPEWRIEECHAERYEAAWGAWQTAWQQSRREALMEAVNVCEDKGDQFAILFGESAQQRGYDCAKAIIELISAAAEEEGK